MNPSKNDITGDFIISGASTNSFRDGWERTFGKKETQVQTDEKSAEEVIVPAAETQSVDSFKRSIINKLSR